MINRARTDQEKKRKVLLSTSSTIAMCRCVTYDGARSLQRTYMSSKIETAALGRSVEVEVCSVMGTTDSALR